MNCQYKVVNLTDTQLKNSESQLNTYGQNGWEIVDIVRIATNDNILIAKRRKG